MKNVMVDLETLDTVPGGVILSIGAVMFDPHEGLGETFHIVINREDSEAAGLKVSPDTLRWWLNQSDEARKTLTAAQLKDTSTNLQPALDAFSRWLGSQCSLAEVRVWGNGAAFDNAFLAAAYRAAGMEQPWKFWNDMCYRTVKSFYPQSKLVRLGTFHNALDDAISQATHFMPILRQWELQREVTYVGGERTPLVGQSDTQKQFVQNVGGVIPVTSGAWPFPTSKKAEE